MDAASWFVGGADKMVGEGWGGGLSGVTRLGDGGGQAPHGFVDLRFRVLWGPETAADQTQLQQFRVDRVGWDFGHIERATQDASDDSGSSIRV